MRARLDRARQSRHLRARHPDLRLARGVDIRSPHRLEVGRDVFLDVGAVLHCGGMDWCPHGYVRLGDRTYVGPNAVLFGGGGVEVGADALISPGVVLTSHEHTFSDAAVPIREQPLDMAPVVLEDDVWIGANAVVLPGVRVGRGAVVGAGAVVTRDVAPGALVMGVPAREVRRRGTQ